MGITITIARVLRQQQQMTADPAIIINKAPPRLYTPRESQLPARAGASPAMAGRRGRDPLAPLLCASVQLSAGVCSVSSVDCCDICDVSQRLAVSVAAVQWLWCAGGPCFVARDVRVTLWCCWRCVIVVVLWLLWLCGCAVVIIVVVLWLLLWLLCGYYYDYYVVIISIIYGYH